MRYLLLITALLATTACQPADIDPSLERVVAVPSPEPDPTPVAETTPTPTPEFCLPKADVNIRGNPAFYWEYQEDLNDSIAIIEASLNSQGVTEYTTTIRYRGSHMVTGIDVSSSTHSYVGTCQ